MGSQFETNLHLFATTLVSICLYALFFAADRSRSRRIDLLNPGFVLTTLYLLYNFSVFLNPEIRTSAAAADYAFVGLIGLFGIMAGTTLAHTLVWSKKKTSSPVIPQGPLLFWSLTLTALSIAMLFLMFVRNIGLSALLSAGATERYVAGHGILTGFFFLLPVGAGFAIPLLLVRRGLFGYFSLVLVIGAMLLLSYLSSSRGEVLITFVLAFFVFHYCVKRISSKTILAIAFSLVLTMSVMSVVRPHINQGSQRIAEAITMKSVGRRFRLEKFEFYFSGVRDMELVEDGPPDGHYLWGSSFLYFLPSLVPSVLAPPWERPQSLEKWYMWTYDPVGARAGRGWGFSPLVDAYFNFGVAGCFLYFFLFSVVLNCLHILALQTPSFSRLRLLDCLIAATLVWVFRCSVSAYVKNYLFIFTLPGLLLMALCLLRVKRTRILSGQSEQDEIPGGSAIEPC